MKTGEASTLRGKAWYAWGNMFRTFVEHTSIAPDLNKLKVVLEGGDQ